MEHRPGRRYFAATVMLAVWAIASPADRQARAQQPQLNPGLAPMLRYFELNVSSGRIAAVSDQRDRKLESQSNGKDRRERLSITLSGDATSISYELATSEGQIGYEVIDGREVMLSRRTPGAAGEAYLEFHQPRSGPVSLRIGEGNQETSYEAGNLWSLLAAEPELCRERLTPLLELLKPDWRLNQTALEAEQSLYDSAKVIQSAKLTDWRRLVDDLGDAKFSRRQAADRELRALGRGAALFLTSIDRRELDAEQQSRIRAILHDLSGGNRPDTSDWVALFLVREPRVWVRLLGSDEEDRRRVALEHLQRLLNRPIAFDPAGDKPSRDAQVSALRWQLESIAVEGKKPQP